MKETLCIILHILIRRTIIIKISLNYAFGYLAADFGFFIQKHEILFLVNWKLKLNMGFFASILCNFYLILDLILATINKIALQILMCSQILDFKFKKICFWAFLTLILVIIVAESRILGNCGFSWPKLIIICILFLDRYNFYSFLLGFFL